MTRRLTALRAPRPLAALTAALLLGAALTWWLWPHRTAAARVTADDYSGRPSACVAADDSPATATLLQHTWAVVQQAAKDSSVNAQQLAMPAVGAKDAAPYLAGLVAQQCTLLVTVGPAFTAAVPAVAKDAPKTRFVAVAPPGGTDLTGTGATVLTEDQLATRLTDLVHGLPAHR
ncbi:hypothetical protein [Kitasatospora cheerisanensis]|uniref:BMP family ABC transporter substrate-binding protein n=1 Tax=Kitasatospora cheerisanensis KCTC 2395 TaxID=1348663 RepID=A0A066YKH9_9ACTN|nr:hypothetical protein [Kitasatospora cheerisanensis]KDN80444.1 hypothetical protein KCH_77760 [Kitasatospora cheerisanensis KCTC 2395]